MSSDRAWIRIIAGMLGGIIVGFGLVRLTLAPTLFSVLIILAGFIILWWVFGEWRRLQRGTDESERDGGYTVE